MPARRLTQRNARERPDPGGRVIATTAPDPEAGQPPAGEAQPPTAGSPPPGPAGVDGAEEVAGPPPHWELTPAEFRARFTPEDGTDYRWVVEYAKAEYARVVETFRKLDDKAAALANYVGAGSGLLTLGAAAAAANPQLSPWVVLAAAPSVGLAIAATVCALLARKAAGKTEPPRTPWAVGYAEYHHRPPAGPGEPPDNPPMPSRAEATFLATWYEATEELGPAIEMKGGRVNWASNLFVAAVCGLALPLAVAVGRRFACLPA